MANDGAANTTQKLRHARPNELPTFPNRNNTSFKIPSNSLKINLEPNPNRNTNSLAPDFTSRKPQLANQHVFTGCGPRITNRGVPQPTSFAAPFMNRHSQLSDHQGPSTNQYSLVSNYTRRSHDVTLLHSRSNRQ
jgi:hypothetical protein